MAITDYMQCIPNTVPVSIYWKDKKGIYLGVNEMFLKVSALNSYNDAIGQSDMDFIWKEQASVMMNNDQETIYNKSSKIYVESGKSPHNKVITYLSYKMPLSTRTGKIIGTMGMSFALDYENSLSDTLRAIASVIVDPMEVSRIHKTALMSKNPTYGLTERQSDCLFYLVKGMTMKQIAKTLNLAPKTIEHHLNAVKNKLNCDSRAELISTALQMDMIKNRL